MSRAALWRHIRPGRMIPSMRTRRALALLAILATSLAARTASAQSPELTGIARAAGDKHLLGCVRVALEDSSGREVGYTRTNPRGLFAIAAPKAGVYRLRFETPITNPVLGPIDTLSDTAYVERVYELPFALRDSAGRIANPPGYGDLQPLVNPGPHYPERLRDAGVEGEALAEFVVDSEGRVDSESVRIVRATRPEFGQAVSEAVQKWVFSPQHDHGATVCQRWLQPFAFELNR